MDLSDYTFSSQTPTWCPGCGNYAVLSAVKKSLLELKIAPKDTVVTYDIGCGGNMVNNLSVCGFATLHGRSIPVAVGAKLANPDLTVIAQGGDGGLLNEGANHLIHAAQRNDNITVLLHNNQIFALTAGQTSSATPKNLSTKSTPSGSSCSPLNPLLLASSSGAGFLARAYAFDLEATTKIIRTHPREIGVVMASTIGMEKKVNKIIDTIIEATTTVKRETQKKIEVVIEAIADVTIGLRKIISAKSVIVATTITRSRVNKLIESVINANATTSTRQSVLIEAAIKGAAEVDMIRAKIIKAVMVGTASLGNFNIRKKISATIEGIARVIVPDKYYYRNKYTEQEDEYKDKYKDYES